MVLRRQTFAGHTLARGRLSRRGRRRPARCQRRRAATSGSASAPALVIAALRAATASGGMAEESALTGIVQAFALACGCLFVALYKGLPRRCQLPAVRQLPRHHLRPGAGAGRGRRRACWSSLAVIGRPLLFASVDPRRRRRARRAGRGCWACCSWSLLGAAAAEVSADHRLAAGVRAAGDARRDRAASHRAPGAEPGAVGAASALAVTWLGLRVGVLLAVPDRLLRHHLRVRVLPAGARRPGCSARRGTGRATSRRRRCSRGRASVTGMFSHPFLRHALLGRDRHRAAACGLVGYFLVLRAQVFTGDALRHVAFTGALAALAFGIDLRLGLFAATIAVALLLGALGRRGRADDVVIGSVFAWILGLGVFFLTLYTTNRSGSGTGNGGDDQRAVRLDLRPVRGAGADRRCGSALGVGRGRCCSSPGRCCSRPLDEAVAAARGVPVGCWASCSWLWSARARPRPPRRSARCCCSACSPPRPVPRWC